MKGGPTVECATFYSNLGWTLMNSELIIQGWHILLKILFSEITEFFADIWRKIQKSMAI